MKNIFSKILSLMMLGVVLLTGCSVDQKTLDFSIYEKARNSYIDGNGIEYNKIITITDTTSSEVGTVTVESYYDIMELDRDFNIVKYSSKMIRSVNNIRSFELNRYYIYPSVFIYTYDNLSSVGNKFRYSSTYEDFYTLEGENSLYALENLVPVFNQDNIEDFTIEKDERSGAIMSFMASAPNYVGIENKIMYSITTDDYDNFKNISFSYNLSEKVSVKVEIEVLKLNNFVKVNNIPSDLNTYIAR